MMEKVIGILKNAGFDQRSYPLYRAVVKSYLFSNERDIEQFLDQIGNSYTQTEEIEIKVVGGLRFKRGR